MTPVEILIAALEECDEYFDNRADIASECNEDGSPRPNEEMQMQTMIAEAIERARRAARAQTDQH